MILKEWPSDKSLCEISFETSTFFMQIHGLPPAFLHEKSARMIGIIMGYIHPNSVNRRCVVANRYLHFRGGSEYFKPFTSWFLLRQARWK